MNGYAIKVIFGNGDEEFVCQGMGDKPAIFPSKARAKEEADFVSMGFDDDEVQSINVVRI